jgi:hypothetical protein
MSTAIWEALARFDNDNQRRRQIADLSRDIAKIGKRCGDCFKWNKSTLCPKEHNVNGMSRGPSCEGIICKDFVEHRWAAERRADLTAKRDALTAPPAPAQRFDDGEEAQAAKDKEP